MDLSWDWLQPVMRVPYVPTLGPIHPDAVSAELLADVITVAGTGKFLPHDKDYRWSAVKDEHVLVDAIVSASNRTLVPTLSTRGRGTVKVHYYGDTPAPLTGLLALACKLADAQGATQARVVWCAEAPQESPGAAVTRVQLKTFQAGANAPVEGVQDLRHVSEEERASFAKFASVMTADGFAFLWQQFQADALTGPILTITSGGRVVGAIGPMETMKDPAGQVRLLPQYFGVLPEQRGRGYGRRLWRAAMHWGQTGGADYQLLLTELGGASDTLCQAEGLTTLGFVHTATA